ncbi:MAG: hypothetical protein ROR55_20975 [Devosia sp.]
MAYGFETSAFARLSDRLQDYQDPEGIPENQDALFELAELYLAAAAALFHLMFLIMQARLTASDHGARFEGFLPIYHNRVSALMEELREFLVGGLSQGDVATAHDFLEGLRRSSLADELKALHHAIDRSSGEGEAALADANAGETATNSLKEQIERRVKRKWIKDILHAINEIISIVKGVT